MSKSVPYTIRTILQQMGGTGIKGALAYVGGQPSGYKCPQSDSEYRSGYRSHEDEATGQVVWDVGLAFRVNGKRGQQWTMIVVYEPNDTYSVWLWRLLHWRERLTGKVGEVISHQDDVYCDMLQEVVEHMYDRAIQKHNQGFINV